MGPRHLSRNLALAPGAALVFAAVDLAVPGAAIDVGWGCRVNGYLEHAAGGGLAQVHPLPSFAGILATNKHTRVLSAGRRATAAGARR